MPKPLNKGSQKGYEQELANQWILVGAHRWAHRLSRVVFKDASSDIEIMDRLFKDVWSDIEIMDLGWSFLGFAKPFFR